MHVMSTSPTRRGGFTLIELLVVISIIALLIGLLLPALSRARTSSRVTRCLGNLRSIMVGTETYSSEYGGVIATGVPPEMIRTDAGTRTGTRPSWSVWNQIDNMSQSLDYSWMQRYWFHLLAPYCAKADMGDLNVYSDIFFCPDDRRYREQATENRNRETTFARCTYYMTDTAFWDPTMFSDDNYTQILRTDMMDIYNDGVSSSLTPGRRYLQRSRIKFPTLKGYVYEANAFHESGEYGYNDCNMGATSLWFDGHASRITMGTAERQRDWEERLGFADITMKMPYTQDDFACGDREKVYWYYSATRNGIRGRDVISF